MGENLASFRLIRSFGPRSGKSDLLQAFFVAFSILLSPLTDLAVKPFVLFCSM